MQLLPVLRQPLRRDLIAYFVAFSLLFHGTFVAPWDRLIGVLLGAMGFHPSLIKEKEVDAPTIIEIDVEGASDKPVEILPPPTSLPVGPDGTGDQRGAVADGGVSDAGGDGGDAGGLAIGDGGSEAGVDGGVGPGQRVRDPNALSGGLASLAPKNKEVNVSMLIRTDHIRSHPIGKQLGPLMAKVPQWEPFLKGTGLDPINDFDVILAMGPRFFETSRITAIIVHHKSDGEMMISMRAIAASMPGSEWIGDEDVPAFRANIDKAKRVFVQLPSGLIITPADGEAQAMAIAHKLVSSKKTAKDVVPRSDGDLAAAWFLRKPSNVLVGIPEDLNDAHITLRITKDGGLALDMDAKAKSAADAQSDAKALHDVVEKSLPTGLARVVARGYVEGYTIEADGDVVRVHHALDGGRVDSLWRLAKLKL